jgi:signal transduction histidine kinase
MPGPLAGRRFVGWLLLTVAFAELTVASSAWAEQKQVLVLYSTRREQPIAVVGDRELPRLLREGLPEGLDYHTEYIDVWRFPGPAYQTALRDFLATKYKGRSLDVVISTDDDCLDFVEANRDVLFRDVPVVFFSSSSSRGRLANSTGLIASVNLRGTVDLATALQPDIRHVFVVSGPDRTAAGSENEIRERLRSFEPRLSFTYLTGLETRELEARLAGLPHHSIILYLGVGRDGTGKSVHPIEYLELIASVANAPIYSWVDSTLDHGVVGGRLMQQQDWIAALGRLALRVLRGESADSIPTASPDLSVSQVDWRQLRRWGISESRLPAGTIVRFRGPSLWRDFRREVLIGLAGLAIQSFLILGLLYHRRARQRAEVESRRNLALAADADRHATMSALTGSIAHELSQPLNSILHNAQAGEMLVASNRATTDTLRDILSEIRTADVRATQIVERHRTMLKNRQLDKKRLDIHAVVGESLALVAHDTRTRHVHLDVDLAAGPCLINGDQVLLQQVLVNLVMNAMDAMAETPPDRRRVSVHSKVGKESVEVSVRDAGTGLPSSVDRHLFEPFVTTKTHGLGIGLTIARTIVEAHRGSLDAHNNPEGGATFTVTLPCDARRSIP